MIEYPHYCYIVNDEHGSWTLGLGYDDKLCQPWLKKPIIRVKYLNSDNRPISEVISSDSDIRYSLSDAELQNLFFSENSPWQLDCATFDMHKEYGDIFLFYETDQPGLEDGYDDPDTGMSYTHLVINTTVDLLFEVDHQDGSPLERHLVQLKMTPEPLVAQTKRFFWKDSPKLPEWICSFTDTEYHGTRLVRKVELRSDNFGKEVPTEDYLCACITEY